MKYVFGNWKMYLDHKEAVSLASEVATLQFDASKTKVAVFPSMLSLTAVGEALHESGVAYGAQHVAWTPRGAYTGAVSAELAHNAGATHTLVGHSERRHVFGETNDDVRKRLEAACSTGLTVVLCIGETREDLDEGKREYRLKKQLLKALDGVDADAISLIVAYEPVWAIGNSGDGTPCAPAEAEEVQSWIKTELVQYGFTDVPVLYGGSVNAQNVVSYMSLPSVDGVLVGGASKQFESFREIIEAVAAM